VHLVGRWPTDILLPALDPQSKLRLPTPDPQSKLRRFAGMILAEGPSPLQDS